MIIEDLKNFEKIYEYAISLDRTFGIKDTDFYIWNCLKDSLKSYNKDLDITNGRIVELINIIRNIWLESDKPISKICDYAVVKEDKIDYLPMTDILWDLENDSEDWEDDEEIDYDEEDKD